jgi:hypothetical protein
MPATRERGPDLATLKDFLRFYIATSRPRLAEKLTVDSINTFAEWFFAGSTQVTSIETDAEQRSEVYIMSPSACFNYEWNDRSDIDSGYRRSSR